MVGQNLWAASKSQPEKPKLPLENRHPWALKREKGDGGRIVSEMKVGIFTKCTSNR